MTSDDYHKKLIRMGMLEKERKERIFNEKLRLIGIEKEALQRQIAQKQEISEREQLFNVAYHRNLNYHSEQALQREKQLQTFAYKDSECQRQLQNLIMAKEQRARNKRINTEAMSNVPTDDFYRYFNACSR